MVWYKLKGVYFEKLRDDSGWVYVLYFVLLKCIIFFYKLKEMEKKINIERMRMNEIF